MSVEISDKIPGLNEASAELDQLMAADAAAANTPAVKPGESASEAGQRAAQTEQVESTPDPTSKPADAPATADPKLPTEQAEDRQRKVEDKTEGSKYAKNLARRDNSWQELNAQKEQLKTEREAFTRESQEFQARRAQAEQEFTPEQYDKAAVNFEAEGKFDLAELAKGKAEELRKNPPAKRNEAQAAAVETQRKEWALKAGTDFPEVLKTNSAQQVRVAQLFKEEPDLKAHPKGIYLAARIASLEAAAASVADKDKELGQLRAKVKDLEILTAPGGPGSATHLPADKPFEQKSDSEQFAELEAQAKELGTLR